jgi:hypothetical protein
VRIALGALAPCIAAALGVSGCMAAPPAATGTTAPPTAFSAPAPKAARTILFVGNSFTQGAHSAARNWRADTVHDLNGAGYGGVPAMFKAFTEQVGLAYDVSLETQGGKTLGFHYEERRQLLDRPWDVVILQELSTLSREKPGDPTDYHRDVARFASLFRAKNPKADIHLMATWTRADQTYRLGGHWFGKPVTAMAQDLRAAAEGALRASPAVGRILPVGEAWNRAFRTRVADPNPYDGVEFGQLNLWAYDHYHASVAGYYLEALVVFGAITGVDPTTLGGKEPVADELGLGSAAAMALQQVARDELAAGNSH